MSVESFFGANHSLVKFLARGVVHSFLNGIMRNGPYNVSNPHETYLFSSILPSTMSVNASHTSLTPCSGVIINLFMAGSVIGSSPLSLIDMKKDNTRPLEPITMSYQWKPCPHATRIVITSKKKNSYEACSDAPYKLTGLDTFSVERATTPLNFIINCASITFIAPIAFILIH